MTSSLQLQTNILITNILIQSYALLILHERIKFIVEYGDNGVINFLDVKLLIENERIIFDNYRKPTNSGRYLNYFSNHPVETQKGCCNWTVGQNFIPFLSKIP